jgi:cell division protein FtsW (lipid II flippase)
MAMLRDHWVLYFIILLLLVVLELALSSKKANKGKRW